MTIFLVVLCGLVYILWMYPFERYMKIVKSYVRNHNCLEGCTVKSYVAKEALEFCAEYMSNMCIVGCWMPPGHIQNLSIEKPLSGGKRVQVNPKFDRSSTFVCLRRHTKS